jgi:hypothetical protein
MKMGPTSEPLISNCPFFSLQPAFQILAAIADTYFHLGRWQECYKTLQRMLQHWDVLDNPFVRLRLGQSLYQLGDLHEVGNWMAPVYLKEGDEAVHE